MTQEEIIAERVKTAIREHRRRVLMTREGRSIREGSTGEKPLPKVSVIITNYNGENVIERCLRQVLAQDYPDFEIIFVDDGSSDRSRDRLTPFLNQSIIRSVFLPKNLGIPAARNAGVAKSQGAVLAFLDNDGYPESDWLRLAVEALLSNEDAGASASAVFFAKSPGVVNGFGGFVDRNWTGRDVGFALPFEQLRAPKIVMYPMGCGLLIRSEVMNAIGPFDTALRRWYDDVELGFRVWRQGFSVIVAEQAIVDHDLHVSMGNHDGRFSRFNRKFGFEAARIRTGLKFEPLPRLGRWLFRELSEWVTTCLSKKNWKHGVVLTVAWIWNLFHLLSVFTLRRKMSQWTGNKEPFLRMLALRPPQVISDSREVMISGLQPWPKKADSETEEHYAGFFLHFGCEPSDDNSLRIVNRSASIFLFSPVHLFGVKIAGSVEKECRLRVLLRRYSVNEEEWPISLELLDSGDFECFLETPRFSQVGEICFEIESKQNLSPKLVIREIQLQPLGTGNEAFSGK